MKQKQTVCKRVGFERDDHEMAKFWCKKNQTNVLNDTGTRMEWNGFRCGLFLYLKGFSMQIFSSDIQLTQRGRNQ